MIVKKVLTQCSVLRTLKGTLCSCKLGFWHPWLNKIPIEFTLKDQNSINQKDCKIFFQISLQLLQTKDSNVAAPKYVHKLSLQF